MRLFLKSVAKTETHLCVQLQDILILQGTKHQLSVYDKMQILYRFFKDNLTFQFGFWSNTKRHLKNKINGMHKFAHTNNYR